MKERMNTEPAERPLHPWRDRLKGLAEGKGNFYHWGPNYTVDPIVMTNEVIPRVLLIRRSDNGKWALPGGFLDEDEAAVDAGLRELQEETGLALEAGAPIVVYSGPVEDHRSTLNAWPETTALLWTIDEAMGITANDDASEAVWISLENLPDDLHGSHKKLIEQALITVAKN